MDEFFAYLVDSDTQFNTIKLVKYNFDKLSFYIRLIRAFLYNYFFVFAVIANNENLFFSYNDEKQFIKTFQDYCFDNLFRKKFQHVRSDFISKPVFLEYDYEMLSSNLISNALNTLRSFGALKKTRLAKGVEFKFDFSKLREFLSYYENLLIRLNSNYKLVQSDQALAKIKKPSAKL